MTRAETIELSRKKRRILLSIIKDIENKEDRTLNNIARLYLRKLGLPQTQENHSKALGSVSYHLKYLEEKGFVVKEKSQKGREANTYELKLK